MKRLTSGAREHRTRRNLLACLVAGVLGAAGLVLAVQSPSSAIQTTFACNSNSGGKACIREQLGGLPGGSIIWARFDNDRGDTNNVAVSLWAVDFSPDWWIGSKPSGGYTSVPVGGVLDFGANFQPLGHGTCHQFAARVDFKDGRVLWSPTETYCYNDTN